MTRNARGVNGDKRRLNENTNPHAHTDVHAHTHTKNTETYPHPKTPTYAHLHPPQTHTYTPTYHTPMQPATRTYLLGYDLAVVRDALKAEDGLAVRIPHEHPPPLVREERVLRGVDRWHRAPLLDVVAGERHLFHQGKAQHTVVDGWLQHSFNKRLKTALLRVV